jgi:ankyrin repeat protein
MLSDSSKCDYCSKLEEKHFGINRYCYLPTFSHGEEVGGNEGNEREGGGGSGAGVEEASCIHCGMGREVHYTESQFCYGGQKREAIEEARRKNLFKMDVEEDVGKGQTPLIRAADKSELGTVRQLLAAGAEINAADRLGRTALHYTAQGPSHMCMLLLLATGADISQVTLQGRTALHFAIMGQNQQNALELLSTAGGPDLVSTVDSEGKGCLHFAAEKQMEELGMELLEMGGRQLLLKRTTDGRTALHFAAESGCPRLCKRMLQLGGAELVGVLAADRRTSLHYAAAMTWIPKSKQDAEAKEILVQRRQQMEQVCESMVEQFSPEWLTFADSSNRTVLHYAAASGMAKTCLCILDRLDGARIKVKQSGSTEEEVEVDALRRVVMMRSEQDGCTALHMAAAKGLLEVANRLLQAGGKPLACVASVDGRTALHWAAGAGHEDICSSLIQVGGLDMVLEAARDGNSALYWAAGSALCRAVKEMLAAAVKARADSVRGWTGMLEFGCWLSGERLSEASEG